MAWVGIQIGGVGGQVSQVLCQNQHQSKGEYRLRQSTDIVQLRLIHLIPALLIIEQLELLTDGLKTDTETL